MFGRASKIEVAITAAICAAIGGCSATPPSASNENDETAVDTHGLPCDVDQVLAAHCQSCHAAKPQFGAGIPLMTWDDVSKVKDRVKARIADDARPMPPPPNARLSDADQKTLASWIGAGAPKSSATCKAASTDGTGPKALPCKPDQTLAPPKPYAMPQGVTDQYVCFGVDVTLGKKKHVTALGPKIDNTKILHHILVFQSDEAWSAEPTPCESFGSAKWKMVSGWAPGGGNLVFPDEAGYPEPVGTTHWIVQLHYNNAQNLAGQKDSSGFDLCTTEALRPHDAGVAAFGGIDFSIPPRASLTRRCDYTLDAKWSGAKIFSATPHMHVTGTEMSTERLPGGKSGTPEKLVDVKFDFQNQTAYPVSSTVNAGDVLRTRCTWKNPTDKAIGFGEKTGDEMCFDFLAYYPAIPSFSWVTPSVSGSCSNEN